MQEPGSCGVALVGQGVLGEVEVTRAEAVAEEADGQEKPPKVRRVGWKEPLAEVRGLVAGEVGKAKVEVEEFDGAGEGAGRRTLQWS